MASTRYTGPAMNLANMRSIGVRTIEAGCECGHTAIVDVEGLPGAIEVPSLRRRLKCSAFGSRPNDVRPNWLEYRWPRVGLTARGGFLRRDS